MTQERKPLDEMLRKEAEDPELERLRQKLAEAEEKLKDYSKESSGEEFKKEVINPNINSGQAKEWYQKGQNADSLDEKIICYQTALAFNPNFPDALKQLGAAYEEKKEFDKAVSTYEKAAELEPENALLHRKVGVSYWEISLDASGKEKILALKKSIASYEKAAELEPDDFYGLRISYYYLGEAYDKEGEHDKAINALKKSIEICPALDSYSLLGRIYEQKEEKDKAKECYKKAEELEKPENKITEDPIITNFRKEFEDFESSTEESRNRAYREFRDKYLRD
jgi:tetratricopeptide (TPR) repeat protein